jgi:cell pole-organizing protein PopZ
MHRRCRQRLAYADRRGDNKAMSASQNQADGGGRAAPNTGDPSMEDILASIRRILSEDSPTEDAQAAKPAPPADRSTPTPGDDVLVLDSSMLVENGAADPTVPEAAQAVAPATPKPSDEKPPAVAIVPATTNPVVPAMSEPAADVTASRPIAELVAPEVAAAAASSVGNLLRTLAAGRATQTHPGGPTIEDLVREELRPLLKEWLDTHLPPIVERFVRAEIERVVGRVVP